MAKLVFHPLLEVDWDGDVVSLQMVPRTSHPRVHVPRHDFDSCLWGHIPIKSRRGLTIIEELHHHAATYSVVKLRFL